jgi:hypothetical protein
VADRLIVVGFLDDVLGRVPVPSLLPWLRPILEEKLERVEAVG